MACMRPVRTHNLNKEVEFETEEIAWQSPKDGKGITWPRQPRRLQYHINPSLAEGWRKENNPVNYFLTTGVDLLFCEQGNAAKQNLQIKCPQRVSEWNELMSQNFMACMRPVRTHNLNKEVELETEEIARQSPKDGKGITWPRQPRHLSLPQERVANEHSQTIMFVTNYPRSLRDTCLVFYIAVNFMISLFTLIIIVLKQNRFGIILDVI